MNSKVKILAIDIAGLGLSLQADAREVGPVIASGTGFVIDDQGHLLTNNHVVTFDYKHTDGKTYVLECSQFDVDGGDYGSIADLVGRDPQNDLALLKLRELPKGASGGQRASGSGGTKKKDKGQWRSLGSEMAPGGSNKESAPVSGMAAGNTGGGLPHAVVSDEPLRPGQGIIAIGYPFGKTLSYHARAFCE